MENNSNDLQQSVTPAFLVGDVKLTVDACVRAERARCLQVVENALIGSLALRYPAPLFLHRYDVSKIQEMLNRNAEDLAARIKARIEKGA